MNFLLTLSALLGTILLVILSNFIFLLIHSEFREYSISWIVYFLNIPVLYLCFKIIKSLFKEGAIKFSSAVNASPDMDLKSQEKYN